MAESGAPKGEDPVFSPHLDPHPHSRRVAGVGMGRSLGGFEVDSSGCRQNDCVHFLECTFLFPYKFLYFVVFKILISVLE